MLTKWDNATELLFQEKLKKDTSRALQSIFFVIIPFYAAFVFLDWSVFPQSVFIVLTGIRIIGLIILSLFFFIGRSRYFPTWLSAGMLLTLGISLVILGLESGGYLSPYFFGMSLLIFVVSNVFPWGPKKTALWTLSLGGSYLLSVSFYANFVITDKVSFSQNAAFVMSSVLISTWGSWVADRLRRESFGQYLDAKNKQSAKRIREEFISIASHELKTPLTTMKLQSDFLHKYLTQNDLGSHQDFLRKHNERTENQIKRLVRLVDDMLDFSRLTTGKLDLQSEKVNLASLVEEVTKKLAKSLSDADISITLDLDSEVIGNWDRNRLEQVITNLVSNAIKYAPKSPLEIRVKKTSANGAYLEIQDHGPGFPEGFQEKIFSPFDWSVIDPNVSG